MIKWKHTEKSKYSTKTKVTREHNFSKLLEANTMVYNLSDIRVYGHKLYSASCWKSETTLFFHF